MLGVVNDLDVNGQVLLQRVDKCGDGSVARTVTVTGSPSTMSRAVTVAPASVVVTSWLTRASRATRAGTPRRTGPTSRSG